jgi:threonine dehydrogenase-like Zn-dependent dehydrogenase
MKQVAILGKRQAALVERPDIQPFDNWVVVKVHAAPMCTEYKRFLSGEPTDVLGHEAAGEVVAVAQPGRVKVGDRVVAMPLYGCGECALCQLGDYIHCQNVTSLHPNITQLPGRATFAQYILKQDWLLPKIPDGVSYERASLACCGLGPSYGAMQLMGVDAFTTILITGAGPVGLSAVVNARFRGARVIVVESVPYRAERALQMGAEVVLHPGDAAVVEQIRRLTDGLGVDCALDCSGNVQAERLCIDATRRKGKVAFIGECMDDLAIRISPDMIRKGLTLIGSWHYNLNEYPNIMQIIQHSPLLNQLVSHTFPMSQVQAAFECSLSRHSAKIILNPWA